MSNASTATLALLFPRAVLLILHRRLQALICLALQISLVGWSFATFWAIYQLITHHPYYQRRCRREKK